MLATRKNWLNKMEQKVYKSGSSLVVVVPSEFAQMVGVKKGDRVKVKLNHDRGKIEYRFSGVRQLSLSKNFIKKKRKRP